jgi:hypothetical protein
LVIENQICAQVFPQQAALGNRRSKPPEIVAAITNKQMITVLLSPDDGRKWQWRFNQLIACFPDAVRRETVHR